MDRSCKRLPIELVNIILEYDGRIKYKKGKYINIIHKYDFRYNLIQEVISKKKEIIKDVSIDGLRFYFEFRFTNLSYMGLCYDYGWSFSNKPTEFEICYFNVKDGRWEQIRSYL